MLEVALLLDHLPVEEERLGARGVNLHDEPAWQAALHRGQACLVVSGAGAGGTLQGGAAPAAPARWPQRGVALTTRRRRRTPPVRCCWW